MKKEPLYAIKRGRKYLQGIDANKRYMKDARAPTMGVRHGYSEFKTIWGDEPKLFEKLTAANYLKTLFEEYRWGEKAPIEIKIIPMEGEI